MPTEQPPIPAIRLVLATSNPVKRAWMSAALADPHVVVEDAVPADDVAEDGSTCDANALVKATALGSLPGRVVVAEDSGLFVDGLDGFPGTHTARWHAGTDDDRARALVDRCVGLHDRERAARFVSVVVLLFPDGRVEYHRGALHGTIRDRYDGRPGDGYGAIFQVRDGGRVERSNSRVTAGDHRDQALRSALASLRRAADHRR